VNAIYIIGIYLYLDSYDAIITSLLRIISLRQIILFRLRQWNFLWKL